MLLLFHVLFFWPWGMWDLSYLSRDWTRTPCTGRWSFNHWTSREVPILGDSSLYLMLLWNPSLTLIINSRAAVLGNAYQALCVERSMSSWESHLSLSWLSEVAQSRPTLWDPMDCNLLGSSVHGIFQPRVLEWVAIFFRDPEIKARSLALQADALPSEPPGKPLENEDLHNSRELFSG